MSVSNENGGVGSFNPTFFTPPLNPVFESDADWLLPIVERAWRTPDNPFFQFDCWQKDLIRRILEIYPKGHPRAGQLRFRQVVVSLGRQNGKTEIGAVLGIYGLIREKRGYIVGIASSTDQARILYDRTMHVIRSNKSLSKRFNKLTETRGIQNIHGGKYEIKAARAGALQGLPISLGLVDELHILKPSLWTALVNGTGGRNNALVVGITTAGDEDSEVLKQLYETGMKAVSGDDAFERFGFFCWQAPEASVPKDDALLLEYLKAANPSLNEGRLDAGNIISDVRAMPEVDIIRYRLNRFVAAEAVFISLDAWIRCQRASGSTFPQGRPVFAIDKSPDWGYATITANIKDSDGLIHTTVVASLVKPNLTQLVNIAQQLAKKSPITFIMDSYGLKDLGKELTKRGLPVTMATQADAINASAMTYSKIMQKKVSHAGDPILSLQFPRTIRKNVGDNFRISRKDSSIEIDAVMATALGIFGAETQNQTIQSIY